MMQYNLKINIFVKVFLILCCVVLPLTLQAETTVSVTGPNSGDIPTDGLTDITDNIDTLLNNFGPAIANAYALGNIAGYPVGCSYIGSLPHLFIGISFNAGLTNMHRFDNATTNKEDVFPGFGLNPVITFGLGLGKGLDVLGKIFVYSTGFYRPPVDYEILTLDKLNVYSFGGKVRYNLVKRKTLMPGVFNFEGITLSVGGDAMYGRIDISGLYNYPLETITIDPGTGPPFPKELELQFEPTYSSTVKYFLASANAQALIYVNFFFLFNLYTGFGTSLNFGSFDVNIQATGDAITDDADYNAVYGPGPHTVASVEVTSSNRFKPRYLMPVYILGLEIDLFALQITVESMVDLRNGRDINLQLGLRSQW